MFTLLMLFLFVILHTISSGKYVVLVCHQYDVCENYVGSVYIGVHSLALVH